MNTKCRLINCGALFLYCSLWYQMSICEHSTSQLLMTDIKWRKFLL